VSGLVIHHRTKKLEIRNLRRRLVVLDSIALVIAWMPAQVWKYSAGMEPWKWLLTEAVLVASGLALFQFQGLYLARVASSRTEEIRRIVRASVVLGIVQALLLAAMSVAIQTRWLIAGPMLLVVLLLWFRGGYRAWLSAARASGHHLRDVIVIGVNADASDLVAMMREHPEAGFRVRGVVGDPTLAAIHGLSSLHMGPTDDIIELLHDHDIRGVITVVGALPARELTPLIQILEDEGIHIQVSNGLHGMSHRRLRATPVAYQSLYYLEPADSGSPQLLVKRWIDIALAGVTLVLAAIPMAAIAIGIKLTDGGPVLFRQKRVGLNGELFHMLKFRSMVVDAEARLAELKAHSGNERHGPLFKLERDPRVTRIGQFIRATSLDELPQLFNVIRGDMSIVGPRPALPSEVAQFDDRLLDRLQMPPGITGLWQVEARDNPHFGAYRRLDLFYVDNWSLNLDLVILVATIEQVLSKAVRTMFRRPDPSESMAAVTTLDLGPGDAAPSLTPAPGATDDAGSPGALRSA
jgi:exopolysaccharide biosynthesis polyprenyl glycosylphosphotransferase